MDTGLLGSACGSYTTLHYVCGNRGQHPSLNIFFKIVTLLNISVDKFFYPDKYNGQNERRNRIDRMLNGMDERELSIMETVAEGIERSREAEAK